MEIKPTPRKRSIREKYTKKYIRYRQRLASRLGFPTTFIISYPNCGRTWLRLMLGHYLVHHFKLNTDAYLDIQTFRALDRRVPRISVHHDDRPYKQRPDELTRNKDGYRFDNVVLLVRDPRDVMVSRYHAARHRQKDCYTGELSSYLRDPQGSLASLIEYYNIWLSERDKPRKFLCLRYESLHADARASIKQVLDVMDVAPVDEKLLDDAVAFAAFDNMRKMEDEDTFNRRMLQPMKKGDFSTYKTRKGVVGDYRNHISDEDLDYVNRLIADRLDKELAYS